MLTHLRFKNWRSLRDVTIDDLQPLTVLIGANSSGKTNIVDGLYFLHRLVSDNQPEATMFTYDKGNKARTLGIPEAEPVELEVGVQFAENSQQQYEIAITSSDYAYDYDEWLRPGLLPHQEQSGRNGLLNTSVRREGRTGLLLTQWGIQPSREKSIPPVYAKELLQFLLHRIQFLGEERVLSHRISNEAFRDLYQVERDTSNVPAILEFMRLRFADTYAAFQDDVKWLLDHVAQIETTRDERDTRYTVREAGRLNSEAPTISSGTAHLIAMLTAYYALDMRDAELPGLVVIEEPDTALNPMLLKRFVEQLRDYTEREGRPRQFILTTHNPTFLNYFQPEEVRIVERDAEGYTQVKKVPDHIREIWLDEYGLGEVWMTRTLGGVPEL